MESHCSVLLKLIKCHRVSDSDDLSMSESEVGKLAVSIEKEMFNLCMNTDNKYKNKYRSLMFNLKDPKNKVGSLMYNDCVYVSQTVNVQCYLNSFHIFSSVFRACFIELLVVRSALSGW